ncbi:cAMP-responsive element-binding protein-like 2 [Delphinus delphis]|uniref:cAMP-responsive element-binding protein-like 2 n=1 Tax=Delphinus delphis TaxID=9728 RepID=UPI0037525437
MDDSKVVGGKVKKPGKRGRKPAKIDLKAKLERSRQSARECRARKKLRYQYLEELVSSRERAICALREELEMAPKEVNSNNNHVILQADATSTEPSDETLTLTL